MLSYLLCNRWHVNGMSWTRESHEKDLPQTILRMYLKGKASKGCDRLRTPIFSSEKWESAHNQ